MFVFLFNDGISLQGQDWILLVILPAEVIIPQPQTREQASLRPLVENGVCNKVLKYHPKFFTLYLGLFSLIIKTLNYGLSVTTRI